MMKYRLFGRRSGLRVSEFALGTGMLGKAFGYGTEPDDIRPIFEGYANAGGNLIDTSDAYQLGQAEQVLGTLLAADREHFVIASKYSRSASSTPIAAVVGNHRKAMVRSVEDSLRRLKTDRIDIYFAHLDDGVTPIDEIVRGLDDLVRAGKILYAGLSNFPAWRVALAATLADLRGWTPISAVQVQYNLIERAADRELLPMSQALGLGVMAWWPLGGGVLTGKYRRGEKGRATELGRGTAPMSGGAEAVLDVLVDIAAETDASPGSVALAWVRAKGLIAIIGPRTRAQLDDNLAACEVVLSDLQLNRLQLVSRPVLGYPYDLLAQQQSHLGIDDDRRGLVA
jgi:aryl-alcohol dehydrogenase-like predicted oxidoreductase